MEDRCRVAKARYSALRRKRQKRHDTRVMVTRSKISKARRYGHVKATQKTRVKGQKKNTPRQDRTKRDKVATKDVSAKRERERLWGRGIRI